MKKSLLLFSLTVALSFSTKAQTSVYHPFPDSDAVWNESYIASQNIAPFGCVAINPLYYSEGYSYIFSNDTIIQSRLYHTLFTPYVSQSDTGCSYTFHHKGNQGYIRQDVALKKVYFFPQTDTVEYLLYDFNLQPGDTVRGYLIVCDSMKLIIKSIDSVLIGGTYRKSWNAYWTNDTNNVNLYMIEGIGAMGGLIEPLAIGCPIVILDASSYQLDCFSQNGKTLYPDSTYTCNIISAVNNLPEKNISITLSPNPFHTTATLEIRNGELGIKNVELKIYDVMGRLVKSVAAGSSSNREIKIERGDLYDGLYFYQLTNSDEQVLTGKFIVD